MNARQVPSGERARPIGRRAAPLGAGERREIAALPAANRRAFLATIGVVVLGLATLLLYGFALVRPYLLTRYVARPLLDLGKIGGYDPGAGLRYTVPLLLIWLAYLVAAALVPAVRSAMRLQLLAYGGALLFAGVLLWLYPITAADIFNYALYGLVQHRGANPLPVPPDRVVGAPLIGYSAWPAHPSPYGPAWQGITYAVTALTGERLLAGLLAFKAALIACHLLNIALIECLAARAGTRAPGVAALAYAWNPLVLYETAGNGHNDIVMLTAILLALCCLTGEGRRRYLTLPLATVAILAKYIAGLWAPVLLLSQWSATPRRDRLRTAAVALIACAALAVLCYAPFWAGGQTFAGIRRQSDLYTTSFGGLALIALVERRHLMEPARALMLVKAAVLVVLAVALLARRPRDGSLTSAVHALFDITLVYLLVGALWFQPWYLVPLAGFATLADRPRRLLAVVYALGGLASYVVYFYVWPALDWTSDRLLVQQLAVAAAHGPVIVTLACLGLFAASRSLFARHARSADGATH